MAERGFHFQELDTKTANADNAVLSANPFNVSVRQISAEISRAVEPIIRLRCKWIDHEGCCCERGIVQISRRQVRSADKKLTELTDPGQLTAGSQKKKLHISGALAGRDR